MVPKENNIAENLAWMYGPPIIMDISSITLTLATLA